MTSPRSRRVLSALLLVAALTTTGTASATDGQSAPARTDLNGAETAATVPSAELQRTAFTAKGSCSPLSAGARTKVRGAVTACVSLHSAPGEAGTARKKAAAFVPAVANLADSAADEPGDSGIDPEFEPDTEGPEPPPPSCELSNSGQWNWSRTGGLCLNGAEVTYTLYDQSGKPLGTGLIQVSSTLATSYKSTDLKETVTAKLVRVTGDVKSLVVKMQVSCSAGCKTVTKQPWYGSTPLTPGQENTGKTKYSGDAFPANTTVSSFQTSYKMYVMMPGAAPVDPSASWSSPANGKVRCDKEQPKLRGCVIPTDDLPVLTYSRSHPKHGIVVPAYEEIMKRRGSDILHAVNQSTANANRAATCKPFTGLYPEQRNADTCDEFPMASTREGGQKGDLCAELTPHTVNGVWSAPATWPDRPALGTETCLRLHVPGRVNFSAGGVLGSLRKLQRLVDGDPFRIQFTA